MGTNVFPCSYPANLGLKIMFMPPLKYRRYLICFIFICILDDILQVFCRGPVKALPKTNPAFEVGLLTTAGEFSALNSKISGFSLNKMFRQFRPISSNLRRKINWSGSFFLKKKLFFKKSFLISYLRAETHFSNQTIPLIEMFELKVN